jgi:sugar O-acyltransferase (sialic acid O-acetyltransferase NeuD family)
MASWQTIIPSKKKLIMWGAGDQGRVNMPILQDLGCEVVALVDDTPGLASPFPGIPLHFGWNKLTVWLDGRNTAEFGFVIAIGNPYGHVRCTLHNKLTALGLSAVSFADPTALIRNDVVIADGLQAMPHAIIHNTARIGLQCIVNTKALVEHDCILEAGVEIAPGATLCGRVHVGENSWIGAGATIRPRIKIGKNSIVGAGAVVVADVPDGVVVAGVPAKTIAAR